LFKIIKIYANLAHSFSVGYDIPLQNFENMSIYMIYPSTTPWRRSEEVEV